MAKTTVTRRATPTRKVLSRTGASAPMTKKVTRARQTSPRAAAAAKPIVTRGTAKGAPKTVVTRKAVDAMPLRGAPRRMAQAVRRNGPAAASASRNANALRAREAMNSQLGGRPGTLGASAGKSGAMTSVGSTTAVRGGKVGPATSVGKGAMAARRPASKSVGPSGPLPSSLRSSSGSNSPVRSSRSTPGGGDERGTVTNRTPFSLSAPRQVAVNPGGLAGFAKGVSENFGRGVAEAGRQIGSVMPKGGRTDPAGGQGLGKAVNAAKGKSWINP